LFEAGICYKGAGTQRIRPRLLPDGDGVSSDLVRQINLVCLRSPSLQ